MALGLLASAMYISCCLCIIFRVGYAKISRRRGKFQWNIGLRGCLEANKHSNLIIIPVLHLIEATPICALTRLGFEGPRKQTESRTGYGSVGSRVSLVDAD